MDWGDVAKIAGSAADAYFSSDDGGKSKSQTTSITPVQPKTVSGANMQDFDILYSQQAVDQLKQLTARVEEWSIQDRDFFQNVYQPYQQNIIGTNEALLPTIEKVASSTLEQNARDMQSNTGLKTMLRQQMGIAGVEGAEALRRFTAEFDNIPSQEERVGQALTRVEAQFGQAGKQLARNFQSRGQTVSQASQRNLAIEKAKAKAGAAGAAAEAARAEKLGAAQAGVQIAGQMQAGATGQVVSLQESQQAGLALPQVSGVQQTEGLAAANLQARTETELGTMEFGTRTKADTVEHTQKGIQEPVMTSGATGGAPAGAATVGGTEVQGERALDENGALITAGSAGAVMKGTREIGAGLMSSLKTAVSGALANPR
jgi:hypothetical protein